MLNFNISNVVCKEKSEGTKDRARKNVPVQNAQGFLPRKAQEKPRKDVAKYH